MAKISKSALLGLVCALIAQSKAATKKGSLKDIDHVVLFMQENRAFDHYFGTMAGVRGFKDPNVQVNSGSTPNVFYQDVEPSLSNASSYLLPWYLPYLGGDYVDATQCMTAGSNGYQANHAAYNDGLNNQWAMNNTPYSWGHFARSDLPIHFAIAEGWTIGDMYQDSVIASTNPNRVSWISGTINVPGGPTTPDQGGVYFDNNESPGCESPGLNCYPLSWTTFPEYLEAANITWQVYQDEDNFDDNPLAWFAQFQNASKTSDLGLRGDSFTQSLDQFYAACAAGTLPAVSYIVGPAELSEHPPYQPKDGAWLQKQIVDAVTSGLNYKNTALIISYDETGGWGDHVTPYHAPAGTAGEWMEDPYGLFGEIFSGPGFRLPFYIVSPWTRGGKVFTEHADHISQIKFLEAWLAAKGTPVTTAEIPPWRREYMSDLTKAFDFSSADTTVPDIPPASSPATNTAGVYVGYAQCIAEYGTSTHPAVPYATQTPSTALATESGFKQARGQLTEGRFLTFEMNGFALTNAGTGKLTATKVSKTHNSVAQRFVIHQSAGDVLTDYVNQFQISSVVDGTYLSSGNTFKSGTSGAMNLIVTDLGNGQGYTLQNAATKQYLNIGKKGKITQGKKISGFGVFSVSY